MNPGITGQEYAKALGVSVPRAFKKARDMWARLQPAFDRFPGNTQWLIGEFADDPGREPKPAELLFWRSLYPEVVGEQRLADSMKFAFGNAAKVYAMYPRGFQKERLDRMPMSDEELDLRIRIQLGRANRSDMHPNGRTG